MPENNSGQLKLHYAALSDIGAVRTENQDSYGVFPAFNSDLTSLKGQLFIIADGVGGHTGGKVASSLAVQTIGELFNTEDILNSADFIKRAIEEANQRIYTKASASADLMKMATTCTALLIKGNTGTIGHVGDSRIYKIENHNIKLLTSDHTQVQEMLDKGILSDKEAENYPSKSILVRAVGIEEKVKVDIIDNISLNDGQYFIICTDGLGKVSEDEILRIVSSGSPENSCRQLIDLAIKKGSKDNITALIIRIASDKASHNTTGKKIVKPVLFTVILLIVVITAYLLFTSNISVTDTFQKSGKVQNDVPGSSGTQELIEKADVLFQKGMIDSALNIFKTVLIKEPMHLGALNGLNKIADYYFSEAERLRSENKFSDALKFYNKVIEIQPDNQNAISFAVLCRNHTK